MEKEFYLIPIKDTRKSFYNKAIIKIEKDNTILLYSYNTLVLTIKNNKYYLNKGRIWSNTTLRHIKEALYQFLNLNYNKNDIIKNDGI